MEFHCLWFGRAYIFLFISLIAAGKAFIYLAALSPFAGIVCGIVIGVESITGYINKREKK